MRNYGRIIINLGKVLKEKGISVSELSMAIDVPTDVIEQLCSGNVKEIDADLLARVCEKLYIQPCEIIQYEK